MGLVNNFPYVTFSTEWQHWQPESLPKDLSICKKSTKEFTESWVIILLKGSNVNTVIYTNPTTNSLELPFLQRRMTSPSLFFSFSETSVTAGLYPITLQRPYELLHLATPSIMPTPGTGLGVYSLLLFPNLKWATWFQLSDHLNTEVHCHCWIK